MMRKSVVFFLITAVILAMSGTTQAQVGTVFTYQGKLVEGGGVANGQYDFEFKLFDDPNVDIGIQVGPTVAEEEVKVYEGYFAIALDFGDVFDGSGRWLEIGVREGALADPNDHTTLSPRQELTPSPHAFYADKSNWDNLVNIPPGFADGIDNNSGGDISGVIAGVGLEGGGNFGVVTLDVEIPLSLSSNSDYTVFTVTSNYPKGRSILGEITEVGTGVIGLASKTGSTAVSTGVGGESKSGRGFGVVGIASAEVAETNYGGYFEAYGESGRGVSGEVFGDQGTASKASAGDWLANSDGRIKTEVQSITDALGTLEKVRLVSFKYTDEYRREHPGIEDRKYMNVVAQEFGEVFPDYVKSSGEKLPGGEEILQVDSYPLTVYAAAAVQELHNIVREKDAEITALKKQNQQMESRLEVLEALMATITQDMSQEMEGEYK